MIPKKYIDQQNEIKKILLTINDWEKRYFQEFSNETGKWITLTIQHLKRFKNSGGSNIPFYYADSEKYNFQEEDDYETRMKKWESFKGSFKNVSSADHFYYHPKYQ